MIVRVHSGVAPVDYELHHEDIIGRKIGENVPEIPIPKIHLDVSRRHGQFYSNEGVWSYEDLGSTNGTWRLPEGDRIGAIQLQPGIKLRLGDFPQDSGIDLEVLG
ncbi:MAG: FHA domain-containing protein [Nanoarchaeota archaeon]|nr:FHA domain-containing protein [Nanoarchaeota archaeon]